jgi:hypothetical protein
VGSGPEHFLQHVFSRNIRNFEQYSQSTNDAQHGYTGHESGPEHRFCQSERNNSRTAGRHDARAV